MSIRSLLKPFTPPILINILKRINYQNIYFRGNFRTWQEARNKSTGFEHPAIFERVKESAKKVKNGSAAYERDSVLFDEVEYSWPLVACLQNVALNHNNSIHLLDFGGSLGTTYFQTKSFLKKLVSVKWLIVEQRHFVEYGKKEFENDQLKFHYSIEEVLENEKPACLLMSGVVQCLEDPFLWIEKIKSYNFDYILLDRTCFIEGDKRLMIEVVPKKIYPASFPCWFFNEGEFLNPFLYKYDLIADFNSLDGETVTRDNKRIYWKGFFFKLKK
jgi:putative methyltransferase (TIGR04325 family)